MALYEKPADVPWCADAGGCVAAIFGGAPADHWHTR